MKAEVALIALTFFLDAFVSCYQSQPHHLWSRPVDLEFLQFWVLLYVFFCRFRLQKKVSFVIKSLTDSSKHTEQSRSRHHRQNSYDRSAQQRVTKRNQTGLESQDVSPHHSKRPTTRPHKHTKSSLALFSITLSSSQNFIPLSLLQNINREKPPLEFPHHCHKTKNAHLLPDKVNSCSRWMPFLLFQKLQIVV